MKSFELPSTEYEFNSIQNELLWKLGAKMRNVAYFWMVMGTLAVFSGIIDLMIQSPNLLQLGIDIFISQKQFHIPDTLKFIFGFLLLPPYIVFIGVATVNAASKLRQIVHTDGNDVTYLMKALRKLDTVCSLYYQLAVLLVAFIWINIFVA
ncbi:hypothetical protein [Calothrix sp. 336/3]|uniref:hypothetical protein n=1 Tax=Calothrix sp. 336/3 TaxID=1337936 RepID=UPI0004E2D047|nr:hypothetical protein [Calothrix sp. 336/3]AKG22711.1 hypothetical protein IJ00_16795 [Calothrix sp. 336/3]